MRGKRYYISTTSETYIGSRGCAIILADPKVSPRHVRIFTQQGQFLLEDLAGGVTQNGKSVAGLTILNPNDILVIGNTQLKVDINPASSIIISQSSPSHTSPVAHRPLFPLGGGSYSRSPHIIRNIYHGPKG